MHKIFYLSILLFISVSLLAGQGNKVFILKIDGSINPASADFIHEGIQSANDANAECLIIELNTPGGLLKSTRVIVSDILASPIPVVIYVAPGGAQAASAGVFITMAAHIAVMAPGTNIGAAHPVTGGGQEADSVMMQKVTNDAVAFIKTISEKRNRNTAWAEDAVRKSLSITETEAHDKHVIDTIAISINELMIIIDGKKIETSDGEKILQTKNAVITSVEKSFRQDILDILSDPNIAYILMMLGIYGLLFELYNPGSLVPGIIGFISLVLAFYSLHTLPINYAGLALIVFAVILFILEIKIISHGLLTIGGVLSLAIGSIMLIQTGPGMEFISISWKVILVSVLFSAAFFIFVLGMGIKAQRRKPTTGIQGIIGEHGETMSDLEPAGQVKFHGEIWNAVSLEGNISKDTKIIVAEVDNLTLKVRKLSSQSAKEE